MTCLTYLNVYKQNFKFSSAHFLIFDQQRAEMLHGHNYQVKVTLYSKNEAQNSDQGYMIDFFDIKKIIKKACDEWDEHILLPQNHSDMKYELSQDQKNYNIHFRDRFYSFPVNETIWLPVTNTSVEQLSELLAKKLITDFQPHQISKIEVSIEETQGQSATTVVTI